MAKLKAKARSRLPDPALAGPERAVPRKAAAAPKPAAAKAKGSSRAILDTVAEAERRLR